MAICLAPWIGMTRVILHCVCGGFGCGEIASAGTAQSTRAVAGQSSTVPRLSACDLGKFVQRGSDDVSKTRIAAAAIGLAGALAASQAQAQSASSSEQEIALLKQQ